MAPTADSTRHLSVFELKRSGALTPGAIRPWYWRSVRDGKITRLIIFRADCSEIRIIFRHGGRWRRQFVQLDRTACPYGGSRPWFRCPCGRRVGVLFDAGAGFYCRKCLRLRYQSQVVTRHWRAIDRAQSITMRLGGSGNLLDPFPERPRCMRRAKYERLRERARVTQAQGLRTLGVCVARQLRRLTHSSES